MIATAAVGGRGYHGILQALVTITESLCTSLERELLNRRRFKTQVEAGMAVFDWIEGWYNLHRHHSSLGYRSPINYERARERSAACIRILWRLRRQAAV